MSDVNVTKRQDIKVHPNQMSRLFLEYFLVFVYFCCFYYAAFTTHEVRQITLYVIAIKHNLSFMNSICAVLSITTENNSPVVCKSKQEKGLQLKPIGQYY